MKCRLTFFDISAECHVGRRVLSNLLNCINNLVETAGIEPASANPPLLDLHAYSVFKFNQSVTQQTGKADDDFSNF